MHIRAANAIAILCGSTGSPESSLLVYVISTKFSFICSNLDWLLSIKQFFTNVCYHKFVASLTLMAS